MNRKRRSLGQHYLTDESVVDLMVRSAEITRTDRVLEIGTGKGAVTRELCKVASSLEAFEVDHENYLTTKSLDIRKLVLHEDDAFSAPRNFDVLVSSLPYSESSNFVDWLAGLRYRRAVVLVQKDFAEKLLADPGEEHYRAVSVISQISSRVQKIGDVSRESFDPQPRVSSTLLLVDFRRVLLPKQIRSIKILFSQRKKRLEGAAKRLRMRLPDMDDSVLSRRVERLTPSEIEGIL